MNKVILILLTVLIFMSAMQLILTRHKNRMLLMELQILQQQQDNLNVELGRLQLEHSTLTNPGRIEAIAKKQLNMMAPENIIFIKTPK
ncbi:cell division protein FtsL [Candidatus Halobeggiatoa sp. HSG11]|nr:cell division protein FtsL [Candidatus Halobeggiatoa sp. HSG11]